MINTLIKQRIKDSDRVAKKKRSRHDEGNNYRVVQKNATSTNEFASAMLRVRGFLYHPASADRYFDKTVVNTIILA